MRLLFEYLLANFFSRDSKLMLPRVSKLIMPPDADVDVVVDASLAGLLDFTVLVRTIFFKLGLLMISCTGVCQGYFR